MTTTTLAGAVGLHDPVVDATEPSRVIRVGARRGFDDVMTRGAQA
ncbi:hypothetical protein [Streptomyces sp. LMG1-1-1.1]